jgi:toxin ParE1/3/4
MLRIHKQALAERDLLDIWLYTFENWDEAQADQYLDQLGESFLLIANNPLIGKACDGIRPGYRRYHAERHVIFYTIGNDTVHIIRVLGAAMDFSHHLTR